MRKLISVWIGSMLLLGLNAQAAVQQTQDADLQKIEQRVRDFVATHPQAAKGDSLKLARQMAKGPGMLSIMNQSTGTACENLAMKGFGGRFVLTTDADSGQPCQLLDLSFPTLTGLWNGMHQTITTVPVQSFSSHDYWAWMNGRYEDVYTSIQKFQQEATTNPAVLNESWVSQLKFKNARVNMTTLASGASIPTSFKASDLDLGMNFQLSAEDRAALHGMIQNSLGAFTAMDAGNVTGQLNALVDEPAGFLDRIRFVWKDAAKVYEVIMDGQFYPLSGPVALVDFQRPYKQTIEFMIRSQIQSAVMKLAALIPEPLTNRLVNVGLTDAFNFLEMTYNYQMNLAEPALREMQSRSEADALINKSMDQGIDLLFANRTGFMTDYVMAIARGEPFDWAKIQKLGHADRYAGEKAREIAMNNINSKLALKSMCDTQPYYNYFVNCVKNGQSAGVYSLLSETSVLIWNLGAVEMYNPARPSEIVLKRGTTYLMAAGLRIFRLPILDFLTNTLATELEKYATSGLTDEAFLRGSLNLEKHSRGNLDAQTADVMKWLYVQNINPFLPKTEGMDAAFIQGNKRNLPKQGEGL